MVYAPFVRQCECSVKPAFQRALDEKLAEHRRMQWLINGDTTAPLGDNS